MIERELPGDAYLRLLRDGKHVIGAAVRESGATPGRPTVAPARRWWFALVAAALLAAGCTRAHIGDRHARGVAVQEECCEHLEGPDRDRCLQEVVRVDDPGAASTATNQQTYACVVEHFVCDPRTGRETRESAQAQLDCTDEL